jgi:3-oxoacyl-[acyl-carrier protein] reductase
MNLNLKGKKALVMGSSDGLGKAVAISLLEEGVQVCLNSRTEEKLSKVQQEIGAQFSIAKDLSTPNAAKELVQEALSLMGNIDILVTNTGGPQKNDFLNVSDEQWQTDFQALWMTPVQAMKALLPQMSKNKFGRVIMITSIAAIEPLSGLTTSNGLRAGLSGLAKSVANEYAKDGVTLNLLLPGYTNTDRLKSLNLSEEVVKSLVPAGRLGKPNELADLATFLASEKGAYITGQSIAVDGGALKSH